MIPKIGLALGGGGVRGLAHIGVLHVLDRAGIRTHAVAGTSIGAIVAAAYGLNPGLDLDEFLEELQRLHLAPPAFLTWRRGGFLLSTLFRELAFAQRFMRSNSRGWGMLDGGGLTDYLTRVTAGRRLEDSPLALAIVATDLYTGEPVVLRAGPAGPAIQASCALPGFFPPVAIGGHLLGDGGFVNMVPADVVRTMGVDLVIAVDVAQDHVSAEVRNGLEALSRALEICARHHKRFHLKAADLVIQPQFGQAIPALDFSKGRHCIRAGVRAGKAALGAILDIVREGRPRTRLCGAVCECERGVAAEDRPRDHRKEPGHEPSSETAW